MKESVLLQIIEKIYHAKDTPACWSELLEQFDAESFQQLIPALQQACNEYMQQAEMQALRDCCLESLNALPMGSVLLNRDGRVLFYNRAAANIIERNNGFSLDAKDSGAIVAGSAQQTKALQKLISNSIKIRPGQGAATTMQLTRPNSDHVLWVHISPLPSQYLARDDTPCAVLFIYDPENDTQVCSSIVADLYGLSSAEAQLATSLASGATLDSIARKHHRSINTVRVQLKQTFRKTNTHSQTDLVRLILSGPAMATSCLRMSNIP
jgi:DNA-binding CsgD family transcriptional regulator